MCRLLGYRELKTARIAFLQNVTLGAAPHANDQQHAVGFTECGHEVVWFKPERIDAEDLDLALRDAPVTTVVAGGVGTIRETLTRADRALPPIDDLSTE